ncbi:DUF1592 domain-containing protein [Nannocystis sp. SCPEA4]|uniref:DUF1592 domain-containing protein n=1 Tax=Nannocystis sp. SCPEA4 TaxID=2996787 RepID=UPI00226FED53|nr:DUF1592 domain-containing protein [Nannocystis sp. SCPEA4]MCY1056942.1 DUF1592 domain-containing protein [Nannocystis sp. SCPEA4]
MGRATAICHHALVVATTTALVIGCSDDKTATDGSVTVTVGTTDGGTDGGLTDGAPTTTEGGGPAPASGVGISGVRRLSRDEYDNTVRDLLGDKTRSGSQLLPEDVYEPFDNDFTVQIASTPLIDALESLAGKLAKETLADPARKAMVIGCTPTGPEDQACLDTFITTFGRRALRRPLAADEVARYAGLATTFITQTGEFDQGVEVVLRAMLQAPEFVYRVERGLPTDEPGVFRLGDHEIATRLSYFLWGTTPDDALLDRADAGMLGTSDDIRAAAELMLADERARARIDRFHAMWLGYFALPHAAELTGAMRIETRLLLEQIVFTDKASWYDLFNAGGTWLNDLLAATYGLPAPGSSEHVWVDYGDSGRQGLLSHGSFLSVAGKFGDTSPTQRGKLIRTRLMCQNIPPPPPDVNVDIPPTSPDSNCKVDRYLAHRSQAGCVDCHNLMDPVGFGLENFDQKGAFRTHDLNEPTCLIDGDGTVDGSMFNGPAELADLLIGAEVLDACAVTQLYRLAMGHREAAEDVPYIMDLQDQFREGDHRFDQLLLGLVAADAFMFRREE